jgi:hypothetical protein
MMILLDEFIQDIQLSVHNHYEVKNILEWIPYNKLYDVKYIAEDDEFGEVYRANWIDVDNWNYYHQGKNKDNLVILRILNNPAGITLKLINKVLKVSNCNIN